MYLDQISVPDISSMTDAERLALAAKMATDISSSLPKELYAGSFTLKSKLPYKACSFREVLVHRVSDLSDVAVELFSAKRLVPGFVMSRAVVETTAMMYWLHVKAKEFSEKRDEKAFDEFLMKGMLGSKDGTTEHSSYNVLSAIDRLDKEFSGIRTMYDTLCEFTHPNWSGVMGSYSIVEEQKFLLHLGKHHREPPLAFGLAPLIACLSISIDYYNSTGKILKETSESYDQQAA